MNLIICILLPYILFQIRVLHHVCHLISNPENDMESKKAFSEKSNATNTSDASIYIIYVRVRVHMY